MNKAEIAINELSQIDDLAARNSPYHRLNPVYKFLLTIVYILLVTSINKYDILRLLPFILFPLIGYQLAYINVSICFKKMKLILPLILMVGIFNPFLERTVVLNIGSLNINAGFISMCTLMLKGIYCLLASFLLVASCPLEDICTALSKLYVPKLLVSLFMLTYRYIGLLLEEVNVMITAYSLRAPGQKGIAFKAWGSFLGQLILRSNDKANRLFESMSLRGFTGNFTYSNKHTYSKKSLAVFVISLLLMILFRLYNITLLLGGIV